MVKKSFYDEGMTFPDSEIFLRLKLNDDRKSALILGYRVRLTEGEYKILEALCKSSEPIGKETFESEYGSASSSVSVHVSHINKKVFPITRRRLIESDGSKGYILSDTI